MEVQFLPAEGSSRGGHTTNRQNTESYGSSKVKQQSGAAFSDEEKGFAASDEVDRKDGARATVLGGEEKDPLLQARETIGEVQAILKQFGISLDKPEVEKSEPEPEVAQAKEPDWEVEFEEEPFPAEVPKQKPLKGRLHALKREHMALNLFVPRLKLKRSDWISSHSLHMPKLHSPQGHLRLFHRFSSAFRKNRHECGDYETSSAASYAPEVKLKSALKKERLHRINADGELVDEHSQTPKRSATLAVRFSHVVVIDEDGKEKFYELTPEITAQRFQLRHGVEVKSMEDGAALSQHEHHMHSSQRFTGKGFVRESKENGIFVEAR